VNLNQKQFDRKNQDSRLLQSDYQFQDAETLREDDTFTDEQGEKERRSLVRGWLDG